MAAKMAAENVKQMYLSYSGIHKNKWLCPEYSKDIVSNYVEIHSKNFIISKMATNMDA